MTKTESRGIPGETGTSFSGANMIAKEAYKWD